MHDYLWGDRGFRANSDVAAGPDAAWRSYKATGSSAYKRGNYAEAEKNLSAALKRAEEFGPEDPRLGISLNNLALAYKQQGKLGKAAVLLRRALRIYKKLPRPAHPHAASVLHNLAVLYCAQGKHTEAEPLYKRALSIVQKVLRQNHPDVAPTLENYADLLRKTNRHVQAAKMEAHAEAIRARYGKSEAGQSKKKR